MTTTPYKRLVAREWLWLLAIFVVVVAIAIMSGENVGGWKGIATIVMVFYGIVGAVRLTVWAVRELRVK